MPVDMVSLGTKYQYRSYYVMPTAATFQVLKADPLRYWLRITMASGLGSGLWALPGPLPSPLPTFTTDSINVTSKWSEEVSRTTSEWYIINGNGLEFVVEEVVQLP